MFHAFDTAGGPGMRPRADWLALLARAPLTLLDHGLKEFRACRQTEWLRRPETGLYMVQGRVGGTGGRFNLGEVTVTRCALRSVGGQVPDAPVGVAYVLGRDHRRAELAALADALLQEPGLYPLLERTVLAPVAEVLSAQRAAHSAEIQSTRVDFFTLAREAGNPDDGEDA